MENAYGIGIKNRYELFCNEDDDPFEILKQQEEEIQKRKTEKVPKDKHKHGVAKAAKQPNIGSNTKKEAETTLPRNANTDAGRFRPKPAPERGARFGGGRLNNDSRDLEERNRRNREDQSGNTAPSDSKGERRDGELRRGRGGPRGGRGRGGMFGRGRGGGSGFDGRGKREFDRQSGSDKSGVKPIEKREGGGAHNWGTVKDDLEIQLNAEGDYNTEGGERSGDEVIAENAEIKGEEEPASQETVKEPEEREMTLDEWKQQQQVKRSVPKYNLRKPGEGEDKTQWNKLYLLKKKIEEEDDEEEEEDLDDEDYVKRGRQKQRIDIEINFGDPPGGRGRGRGRGRGVGLGRGGRGNSRGGRGGASGGNERGGGGSDNAPPPSFAVQPKAGTSPQQSAPKVDDWNDFPSLATA